ncbi:hypothetical protein GF336_03295 [Candidatus Woesearchaeota archaeon]|nr:hypothetical protein [Candidatus Woesearchaeota archaeon]
MSISPKESYDGEKGFRKYSLPRKNFCRGGKPFFDETLLDKVFAEHYTKKYCTNNIIEIVDKKPKYYSIKKAINF